MRTPTTTSSCNRLWITHCGSPVWWSICISATRFRWRTSTAAPNLLERLRQDDNTKPLLNGVYLPFCLPSTEVCNGGQIEITDYGRCWTSVSPALGKLHATVPQAQLQQLRKGNWKSRLLSSPASRTNSCGGDGKGVVSGFTSRTADARLQRLCRPRTDATLPEQFLLAGALKPRLYDRLSDVLARDNNTRYLDLAALRGGRRITRFGFGADDTTPTSSAGATSAVPTTSMRWPRGSRVVRFRFWRLALNWFCFLSLVFPVFKIIRNSAGQAINAYPRHFICYNNFESRLMYGSRSYPTTITEILKF